MPIKREWKNKDSEGVEVDFSQDNPQLPEDEQLKLEALRRMQAPSMPQIVQPLPQPVLREPQSIPDVQPIPNPQPNKMNMDQEKWNKFQQGFRGEQSIQSPSVMDRIKRILGQ